MNGAVRARQGPLIGPTSPGPHGTIDSQVKAFGGFGLATFAPRAGKVSECTPDDGYSITARGDTLQASALECP